MLQEKALRQKEEAKKHQQQQKAPTNKTDTADSSHAAAAVAARTVAGTSVSAPGITDGANPEKAVTANAEGAKQGEGAQGSPFACVSAILGWETFHMVHVLWIGLVDMPGKAPEKDWEMQVWTL